MNSARRAVHEKKAKDCVLVSETLRVWSFWKKWKKELHVTVATVAATPFSRDDFPGEAGQLTRQLTVQQAYRPKPQANINTLALEYLQQPWAMRERPSPSLRVWAQWGPWNHHDACNISISIDINSCLVICHVLRISSRPMMYINDKRRRFCLWLVEVIMKLLWWILY